MYTGDTYPPMRFQLTSGLKQINLVSANSIQVNFKGASNSFGGQGTALWPPVLDSDGMHRWNLEYDFGPNDTANPDTYTIFVVVTWPQGIQTFTTTDHLVITASGTTPSSSSNNGNGNFALTDPLANSSIPPGPQYPYDQPPSGLPVQVV